jgi:hypothetical protein
MTEFELVKGFLQEGQLAMVAEDSAEGMIVVEDEERGLKHLVVGGEDPMRIFTQRILEVPTPPPDASPPDTGGLCARRGREKRPAL